MTTPTQPSGVVRFEKVCCTFEHRSGAEVLALNNISVEVPPGQFVCVLGRSGHGKSTMLRVLAGLQPVSGGTVSVDGAVVSGPGSDRPMVFQQDTVFPWMHVRANVEFSLVVQGVSKRDRRKISDRWLEEVGLTDFAESWPRELSGGMRKRVAIAAVLSSGANVWLMDEPFGSLDYFTRRDVHEVLLRLLEQERKTVFFVTHDIEEALILADRILVLDRGEFVADLPVELPRPRNEEVRALDEAVQLQTSILASLETAKPQAAPQKVASGPGGRR